MGGNAAWLLGCRVLADLLNFALFLLVSRRFGPQGVGVYAYGFAIAGFMYAWIRFGIDEYGVREYTRVGPERRARLMSDLLGAQACIAVAALLALALYLSLTNPSSETLEIIAALTVYQLCSAFAGTLFVPATAEQRMAEPAVKMLLSRAIAMIAAGVLIWVLQTSLAVALWAFAAAGIVMLVLSARSAASYGVELRLRVSAAVVRDGARALWSFAAVDVMGQLLTRTGVIALTLQIGEAAAGTYATGLKLVEAACLPVYFLGLAAYPRMSRAFLAGAEFERLGRQVLWVGLGLSVVLASALYLAAPPLLVPVFGPKYAGAEPVIAAMAALVLAQGAEVVLGRLLLSANLNVARAVRLGIGASVCAVATVGATFLFGIEGTVAALVISYLIIGALYGQLLHGALRRRPLAQVSA